MSHRQNHLKTRYLCTLMAQERSKIKAKDVTSKHKICGPEEGGKMTQKRFENNQEVILFIHRLKFHNSSQFFIKISVPSKQLTWLPSLQQHWQRWWLAQLRRGRSSRHSRTSCCVCPWYDLSKCPFSSTNIHRVCNEISPGKFDKIT